MACIRNRRGRLVVDWRNALGQRKWKTCRDIQEAEEILKYVSRGFDTDRKGRLVRNIESCGLRELVAQARPGVYFLYCEETGLVKIGRSFNLAGRVSAVRKMNPSALHLVWCEYCSNPIGVEEDLHQRFAGFCHHGEWFVMKGPLLEYIRSSCL